MHPSAQAATVWNIRNLLITAVALLSLLGLAVSSYVLHNASLDRATASDAASINETADLLLESAGQWARERGATNLALNAANPATDAQVAAISTYRKSADQAFERAIARLSRSEFFQPRATGCGRQACAMNVVAGASPASRCRNCQAGQGVASRPLCRKWAPMITALIVASQNLRVAAAMDEDNVQALLSSLQNLKHFVWIMSEYLGRETSRGGRR